MNAVARPPDVAEDQPVVLLESALRPRRGSAWALSLALHVAGLTGLALAPRSLLEPPRLQARAHSTPLVAPPRELTQRDPNRGRVAREFTLESLLPRAPLRVPAAMPPLRRSPERLPSPAAASKPASQPRQLLEAPTLEDTNALAQAPARSTALAALNAPPPQIQPEEKPKLAFETPGRPSAAPRPSSGLGQPRIAAPGDSVTEAARAAARRGAAGMAVGDVDLPGSGGLGGGINLPGSMPRNSSALEMLSDPRGVDFKPYLIQVLAAVRRNWLAVIPESARLGTSSGRVQIQFAIARDGRVPKLVIALPSGADALDRAAVAGISASNPFPPLPSTFPGEQIRLQFTFAYNLR